MFAHSLISLDTWGDPQIWAGDRTLVLPAPTSALASLRCVLRSVGLALPYSPVRFRKPVSPSGNPTFPDRVYISPSPGNQPSSNGSLVLPNRFPPVLSSMRPPDRSFLSTRFMTPAIASEPYCADAPSRSTSACSSAMPGMSAMSGPCEPSARPLPYQVITAARCRRFPLTSTSEWSGARPRRLAGRTKVAASLIGWMLTLNDGTTLRSRLAKSTSPCCTMSRLGITSTGTGDSVTVLGCPRLPTTTRPSTASVTSLGETFSVVGWPSTTVTCRRSDW